MLVSKIMFIKLYVFIIFKNSKSCNHIYIKNMKILYTVIKVLRKIRLSLFKCKFALFSSVAYCSEIDIPFRYRNHARQFPLRDIRSGNWRWFFAAFRSRH